MKLCRAWFTTQQLTSGPQSAKRAPQPSRGSGLAACHCCGSRRPTRRRRQREELTMRGRCATVGWWSLSLCLQPAGVGWQKSIGDFGDSLRGIRIRLPSGV
jgi:hypothetical protein